MAEVTVIGGGLCGLLGGMLLAEDGHEVTVLERDAAPPPAPTAAWDEWDRSSIRQFRLGHYFLPPFLATLNANLPAVAAALEEAGAYRTNPIHSMPAEMSGGVRDDDHRFDVLTGSRPMVEATLAACAERWPGLRVLRNRVVTRLLVEDGSSPVRVTGAVSVDAGADADADSDADADEQHHRADLVVDAAGRHSGLPRLLAAVGAPPPAEENDDSGFIYYGRAYRAPDGQMPVSFGGGLQEYGTISTLALPADNGSWAIAFVARGDDKLMRRVRDEEAFDRLWRSFPLVAHWVDGIELTDVKVMGNLEDRIRNYVVDGEPVATGVVAIGDSWACTNPSVGRGASMGLLHTVGLRDVLRETPLDRPEALVTAFARWTAANVEPFYRETVRSDRHRLAAMAAERHGGTHTSDDPILATLDALANCAFGDPDLLRMFLDYFMMNRLADDLFADPDLRARIQALGATGEAAPGPDRAGVEAILAS